MRDAATVIVTGTARDRFRLDAARAVGADHTIDIDAEDVGERVAALTGGRMADVVVDLTDGRLAVQAALDWWLGGAWCCSPVSSTSNRSRSCPT